MQKSKLFNLLRTLSEAELGAFGKYLKRQHQHDDSIAILVFEYIRKFHPDFQDKKKLDMSYAFKKIFDAPLESIASNRMKMLNALSDLNVSLKEFLLFENVKMDTIENRFLWLNILNERKLNEEFLRKSELLKREVAKIPKLNVEDYMRGATFNYQVYYHLIQNKLDNGISTLDDCAGDLDLFYAISRLKVACEIINRQIVLNLPPGLEAFPIIMELSKNPYIAQHPLFALYLNVYKLISSRQDLRREGNQQMEEEVEIDNAPTSQDAQYQKLELLLIESVNKVDPKELHVVLGYLHNYAAWRTRHGHDRYWALMHHLNKSIAESEILGKSGEVSAVQFNNFVKFACEVGDLVWAAAFIEKYQHLLPAQDRKDAVELAQAQVLFEEKDYKGVVAKLNEVTFSDLHTTIRAKVLIIVSSFEMEDSHMDVVELCISFEGLLKRRRDVKAEMRLAAVNFIKIVKKLSKPFSDKVEIRKEIQKTEPLIFKSWLLKKAAG